MSTYGDPSTERLGNGRTMADLMRAGPKGLRGVVVAPATPGGIPTNFNPHDTHNLKINVINPDGSNVHSLSLDQITSRAVSQALSVAQDKVHGNDINSIRERTAVAFEELAKFASSNVQRVPTKPVKVVRPAAPAPADDEAAVIAELEAEAAQPIPAASPVEQIDRNYSPMAAFGLKKNTPAPRASTVAAASTQKVSAPQKLVYFEKEGLGTVPAFYHDVIVSVTRDDLDIPEYSGFIVLVYDLRFEQHAARWFPPADDPYQRPWAVQIKEDQRLYLVHTTGFQYVYDSREYCILRVERAVIAGSEEV